MLLMLLIQLLHKRRLLLGIRPCPAEHVGVQADVLGDGVRIWLVQAAPTVDVETRRVHDLVPLRQGGDPRVASCEPLALLRNANYMWNAHLIF